MVDSDKRKHYAFCYNVVSTVKTPIKRQLSAIMCFFIVSIFKELLWDLGLKRGTPDLGDVLYNFYGCWDAAWYKSQKWSGR